MLFPLPGGPSRMYVLGSADALARDKKLKMLIASHHHLTLNLLDRLKDHRHHNKDAYASQRDGLNTRKALHHERKDRDNSKEQGSRKRNALNDVVKVFRRRQAGRIPGM